MTGALYDDDPAAAEAEAITRDMVAEGYVGRRRLVDDELAWCRDPIGHHSQWLGSELCWWERGRGITRPEGICPQCGGRMP